MSAREMKPKKAKKPAAIKNGKALPAVRPLSRVAWGGIKPE